MKLKPIFLCCFLVLFLFVTVNTASAITTNTWSDNTIYWPTWPSSDPIDNVLEPIGGPDLTSISVTYDENNSNQLLSVNIEYTGILIGGPRLFIDVDGDLSWDNFVGANNALYSLISPISMADHTPGIYEMSTYPWGNYRNDHPVGFNAAYLSTDLLGINIFTFDGALLSYDFSNLNIPILLGDNFFFSATVGCANDVISTPEPATAIFLGGLFLGLGVLGRRRFLKR